MDCRHPTLPDAPRPLASRTKVRTRGRQSDSWHPFGWDRSLDVLGYIKPFKTVYASEIMDERTGGTCLLRNSDAKYNPLHVQGLNPMTGTVCTFGVLVYLHTPWHVMSERILESILCAPSGSMLVGWCGKLYCQSSKKVNVTCHVPLASRHNDRGYHSPSYYRSCMV